MSLEETPIRNRSQQVHRHVLRPMRGNRQIERFGQKRDFQVKSCPGGEFSVGARVAALMGGLGRTINGSYAEYTRAPVSNVALIEADLPWAQLAAIPETYATAWTCLFRNLEIVKGQTLVVRGGGSSFGRAAINMAVNAGVRVIATARSHAP